MKASKMYVTKAKHNLKSFSFFYVILSVFIFTFFFSASQASASTYYVATTGGLDTYSGTLAQPFKTITKGLTVANAGDTVLVKAGTYKEYVGFTKSGTAGDPITLKNYASDVVTVDAENSRSYAIYGDDVSNIVIDGINVQNATSANIVFTGNQNLTIKNLTSTLAVGSSVTAMNIRFRPSTVWSTNLTLQNVNTYGGSYGVYLGDGKINGLNIIGGKYQYAAWDGLNLTVESPGDTSIFNQNILVDGVETSYNQRQGIDVIAANLVTLRNIYSHHNGATGIQLENQVSNALIEDFICENNSQNPLYTYETGVWIDASSNIIVRRGIMRNNQTGFRVAANSTNVTANNLLIYSNQDGYSDGNSSGIDFSSSDATLYNSVIDSNSLPSSNRGSVAIRGTGNYILKNNIISNDKSNYDIFRTGTNTLISDNNLIYNTRAVNVYNLNGAATWAAYKSASGQDSHSINGNPLFTSTTDFSLQSGSPAINAGVNVGLTTDYLNNTINGLPDIGAYESNYSTVKTYYVATTGLDTNAGTSSLPFRTIQKAADVVAAGDTVIVENGTYTYNPGSFFATLSASGNSGAYITFKARNIGGAILDGQNNSSVAAFSILGSYINISGFDIKGMSGVGVEVRNGASYINFSDLKIYNIGRGCYENDDGRTGFTTGNGSYIVIERVLIHDIGAYAPGENGCTYSSSWTGYQTLDHGIYIAGTSHMTIKNNVFYNIKSGFSIQLYSGSGFPSSYVDIINNTFENGNPFQQAGHVVLWNSSSNVLIANNIFKDHLAYAIRAWQGSYVYSNVTITKNITSGGNGNILLSDVAAVTSSNNYNSTDPLFTNEAAHDYSLKSSSPAINVGYNTGLTTDYLGNARSSIDIGAYEYQGVSTYTLTYTPGTGGTITGTSPQTINSGSNGTAVTAVPSTGYTFANWSDGITTATRTDTNVSANKSVTANFTINTYTLTASTGSNGTVTPTGVTTKNYATSQTYTITPSANYHIVSVLVDGSSVGTVGTYTFSNISANHTISATFAIDTKVLTVNSTGGGSGTVGPSGTYNYGTVVTLTNNPDASSSFISWGGDADCTDGSVTMNAVKTCTATFTLNNYTLTYTPGTGGTITGTSPQTINSGSNGTAVTAVPSTGYTFTNWSDGITTASRTEMNVTANKSVTANFTINTYTITASSGSNGTVTPTGATTKSYGTSQTYTITPATNYHIVSVLVDGTSVGTVGTYTFTNVTATHTISATFAINTFTITASTGSNGTVTPTGATTKSYGTSQTYTITPATNYHIVSVLVDGTSVGTVGTYTFSNVSVNHTISATFAIDTKVLTVNSTGSGSGTVGPSGTYNYGTVVTLTNVPDAFSSFISWGGDADCTDGSVTMNAVKNCTATFTLNTYTLSYTAGTGGTITGTLSQTVNSGSNGTSVTAVPSTGYTFTNWSDGITTASRTETNVTANKSVTANFSANTFTLTASTGSNGTVTPTGATTKSYGTSQTYTITPATGYHIVSVLVDGTSVGTVGAYTFTNVSVNHTISATFAVDVINTYSLTTNISNGTITKSPDKTQYDQGEIVTLNATSATGYTFSSWSGDAAGTTTTTTVTMDANKSVTANFTINTYTLTSSTGSNGTVTPTGVATKDYATSQIYNITPSLNYHVANVLVDGSSVGTVGTYTFTNISSNHTISATFAIDKKTLTVSTGGNGTGGPSGLYNYGSVITLTSTPSVNYHLLSWSGDADCVDGSVTMNNNVNCTANFAPDTKVLTVNSTGSGSGTVGPSGTYNYGTVVTLTNVPDAFSSFISWGGDADCTDGSVTMNAVKNCTATFTLNTYTLSYTAGTGGTITGTLSQTVNSGSNGTSVTAVPSTGYTFTNWSDGITTASRTETNVTDDLIVTAYFISDIPLTYTLNTNATNGTVNKSPDKTLYDEGDVVTLSAFPSSGYVFSSWAGDASGVLALTTVTMNDNLNVVANFSIISTGGGSSSGGGGGGGGGSSSSNPPTTSNPSTPIPPIVIPENQSSFVFTQTLQIGSKGNEVIELQKILIKEGYLSGKADGSFGKLTLAALVKFQQANGLKIDGITGPEDIIVLNKKIDKTVIPIVPSTTLKITKTIRYGSNLNDKDQVKILQLILISKGYLLGKADGIFGRITLAAIKVFQKANGLTTDGVVGAGTRALLNK